MRIALTSSFFRPKTSGSAHFSSGLAAELSRLGHDVLVVTCTPGDADDDAALPYRVVRLAAVRPNLGKISFGYEIPFCSPSAVRTLGRELHAFAPDVVHLNEQFFDLSVWTGLWARRRQVPRVMTLHTAFTHNVPWMHQTLRAVDATVVSGTLAAYDPTFVAIDKFMANYAKARFPRRRQEFIPIPVRADVFAGGDADVARERLRLREDDDVILSLGHAIPLRDRLLLVRALPLILREHPRAKVVVVGRVYDERFLHLADELGVRHAVIADGEVPHDEVQHYVAAATLECHETQGYGLGTASLEIMASGVPVAAVVDADNFPGFELRQREHLMMAHEDAGSLADAIGALLDDAVLRKTVAEGAHRLVVDRFRIERVAEEYVALYAREAERALSSPRTAARG
jgi:glycosyltransferase involved in cell wall biosynthesis